MPPDPPARGIGPPDPALPHVEECTYFWGVNTSWGINMAESKDLFIRKTIRLHNQQILLDLAPGELVSLA